MSRSLSARLLVLCIAFTLILPLANTWWTRFLGTQYSVLSTNTAASGAFANSQFQQVWSRADLPVAQGVASRSWLWGPGPGEVRTEPFAGEPGGTRTVQYFDKARMEVNTAVDPSSPWATTTGLLVVEMVSGKVQTGPNSYEQRAPADLPVAGDSSQDQSTSGPLYSSFLEVASLPGRPERRAAQATGARIIATIDRSGSVGSLEASQAADVRYAAFSQETGHNIPDVFQQFMQTSGLVADSSGLQNGPFFDPVYLLGYPITEAYWTTVPIDGKPVRVLMQLYQRRVLTYIPSYNAGWRVQMGNVGQHYYQWRYSPASIASPAPSPSPTAAPGAGDTFVHVAGSSLYYQGKLITLKGTNYWLSTQSGVGTWAVWDGPMIKAELDAARQLGVNTIRIGIPYDQEQGLEVVWGAGCGDNPDIRVNPCDHVNGPIANEMKQFLQIASGYNMKVIFTLFEWSNKFPQPNTDEYRKQLNYLQGVVTPFVDDDRVIGWDLHNEPENYDVWRLDNHSDQVLAWISNIASVVRGMDKRHLLTVGVADYRSLWLGTEGSRLVDIVDFVSFHCYDAGGLHTQIEAVKAHTQKPVVLGEMGWPTGPASLSKPEAVYDEPTQQFLYRVMLPEVSSNSLAGVIQWTLEDNPLGTPKHYIKPTTSAWFGLVRRDGSFKPAAADFRDMYKVLPLPSTTTSNLPLTTGD